MMPLSPTDVQVIKLVSTPKLPASLFQNAQPIPITVIASDNNQATILLSGRQLQTQTTVPLTVGQQLMAQPELVDGKVQLKIINNDTTDNKQQNIATKTGIAQANTTALTNSSQLLKVLTAPATLPALLTSTLVTTQAIPVRVLTTNGNQATLLIAGKSVQIQSNTPLTEGENLSVLPEQTEGGVQLRVIQNPTPNPNATLAQQPSTTTAKDNSLPSWTAQLPTSAKEALSTLKNSLPTQTPLTDLLRSLTQNLPSLLSAATSDTKAQAWQSFMAAALTTTPPPTAEKVQQSVIAFNAKLSTESSSDWKKDLTSLINNEQTPLAEKNIAQGILSKTEQTSQMQTLHQMAGQAVLLQEIPINTNQGLDNFTLEIDVPKPETPDTEQQWKIFIQLALPEGDFTSRLQMDKDFNVRLQLWGSNEDLSKSLQDNAKNLKSALQEQGLNVESLIIALGKPQTRTEQPSWQKPLVDVHG
jgi:hypothetical protein